MTKKIFKTIIAILTLAAMLFSFSVSSFADEKAVTVYVNGIKINFDVEPIIDNGRTLVPLRYIFEALGAKVDWRGETSTAVAKKGEDTIEITVGSNILYKNGIPTELDVGAKLIDGRTLVPARAVSEGMGCDVSWDAQERRVIIAEKGALAYYQLSDADAQKIRDSKATIYENIICSELYENIKKSESSEYYKDILNQVDDAKAYVDTLWKVCVTNAILKVQEESETYYLVNEYEDNSGENITASYEALAKHLGMLPSDVYTSSYEKTPKGKNVILLTMKASESGCAFAAIVAADESIRYFVLSPSQEPGFYEITDTGKSGYNFDPKDKNGFLSAIDKA